MATYTTNKALIITDSAQIPVTAALTSSTRAGLMDWRGTISASPETLRPLLNSPQVRIRLDNGHEAEILIPDPAQALTGHMSVIGNNEPPF